MLCLNGRKKIVIKNPNPSNHTAYNNRALFSSSFLLLPSTDTGNQSLPGQYAHEHVQPVLPARSPDADPVRPCGSLGRIAGGTRRTANPGAGHPAEDSPLRQARGTFFHVQCCSGGGGGNPLTATIFCDSI